MAERLLVQTVKDGLFILDFESGRTVAQFKKSSGLAGGVAFFGASSCTSHLRPSTHLLAAVDVAQPFLHLCDVERLDSPLASYSLPEKLCCIAFTPCSSFLLGGGLSGMLYVWYLPTGQLVKTWRGHYRAVTCLTLSSNGMYLFTASEDSSVCCYPMHEVLGCCNKFGELDLQEPQRLHRWMTHSLAVVSLVICDLSCYHQIVVSGSLDRHLHVWKVHSDTPLFSYRFPSCIRHIAINPVLVEGYVCVDDNKIYIVDMKLIYEKSKQKDLGSGTFCALNADECFLKHEELVVSCGCNVDGSYLVSCARDGLRVWDIISRQVLRHFGFLGENACCVQVFLKSHVYGLSCNDVEKAEGTDLLLCYLPLSQPLKKTLMSTHPELLYLSKCRASDVQQELRTVLKLQGCVCDDFHQKNPERRIAFHDCLRAIEETSSQWSVRALQGEIASCAEKQQEMVEAVQDMFLTFCDLQGSMANEITESPVQEEDDPFTWLHSCVRRYVSEHSRVGEVGDRDWLQQSSYVDRSFAGQYPITAMGVKVLQGKSDPKMSNEKKMKRSRTLRETQHLQGMEHDIEEEEEDLSENEEEPFRERSDFGGDAIKKEKTLARDKNLPDAVSDLEQVPLASTVKVFFSPCQVNTKRVFGNPWRSSRGVQTPFATQLTRPFKGTTRRLDRLRRLKRKISLAH